MIDLLILWFKLQCVSVVFGLIMGVFSYIKNRIR